MHHGTTHMTDTHTLTKRNTHKPQTNTGNHSRTQAKPAARQAQNAECGALVTSDEGVGARGNLQEAGQRLGHAQKVLDLFPIARRQVQQTTTQVSKEMTKKKRG